MFGLINGTGCIMIMVCWFKVSSMHMLCTSSSLALIQFNLIQFNSTEKSKNICHRVSVFAFADISLAPVNARLRHILEQTDRK